MNVREAFAPKALPRREYLATNLTVNGIVAAFIAALAAALAVSRATHHHLTGVFTAGMIAVAAALSAGLTSLIGLHTGALDTTGGLVVPDPPTDPPADPPAGGAADTARVAPRSAAHAGLARAAMWRRASTWFALTLVWAGGLGMMLAAVINGRVIGYPVLFVAVLVGNVLAGMTAGAVAVARGISYAQHRDEVATRRPLRARAWADVAPLLATIAAVGAAGSALLLFHDYGTAATAHVLSRQEMVRDLLVVLVANGALMGWLGGRAGRAEAALGLVELDDPTAQRVPAKAAFHRNAIGWAIFIVYVLVSVLVQFVPAAPSLWQVAVIRGVYCAAVAFIAAGLGYVRGAANTLGASPEMFDEPAPAGVRA